MMHRRFIRSFGYALKGISVAIRQERNMRVHVCTAFYVYLFSAFYDFTKTDYVLLTIMVAGVMALELVNSSLERVVDRPTPDRYAMAGVVKDMAAGAVLVYAVGCAVGGVLLFWDVQIFLEIIYFFIHNIVALVCLLASLVCAVLFITRNEDH